MQIEERYAVHPTDFKQYDTQRIRDEFVLTNLFPADDIALTYSLYDRYVVGGSQPGTTPIKLETFDALKAEYFLERREMGIINIGGPALITADGETFEVGFKEAVYLGRGTKEVTLASKAAEQPAKLYLNSAPAHRANPNRHVTWIRRRSWNWVAWKRPTTA